MLVESKKPVFYYYDSEIGIYSFKKGHPMRPLRVQVTHDMIAAYGLLPQMQVYDSTFYDMPDDVFYEFHSEEYIDLLKNISEETLPLYQDQFARFGFSADCPHPTNSKFYDLCKLYSTGSVLGSRFLLERKADLALNWSGGLHHAKRQEASGFCYVNDCVLGILELLKEHPRVLYVDIDVHHGDGVEEAFVATNRVLTCSFHKAKDFFPGTGHIDDIGFDEGRYHAVNFPLSEGMNDESYEHIFRPVIDAILDAFRPGAVVLQCGSDSLAGDKLGCFNLSVRGHGACLAYLKSKNIPMLCLGGGGYTLRNIPRCWTYETSLALGEELPDAIPDFEYSHYFYPENRLHTPVSNMENMNKAETLHETVNTLINNVRRLKIYSPEMEVESGAATDSARHFFEDAAEVNREAAEELSEPHRSQP